MTDDRVLQEHYMDDLRARLDPHPQYKTLPEALSALAERDREYEALAEDCRKLLSCGEAPDTHELEIGVGDIDVPAKEYPALAAALREARERDDAQR